MNTQLVRCARLAFSGSVAGFFSTGNVSPVSTAWLTKKSFASSTMPSAGIRLPADSMTMSPGTSCSEGSVWTTPPLSTLDRMVTCDRSLSTALLAVYSCTKPRNVLPNTMASTMLASIHSPTTPETTAAKIRISTSGLRN